MNVNVMSGNRPVPLPHMRKGSSDRNISIRVDTTQEYRSDLELGSEGDESEMVKMKDFKGQA
jgi:hypothetical protein